MNVNSKKWVNKWSKINYKPIQKNYICPPIFGTTNEPGSSIWLSCLMEALNENFKEEMCVLDYGCGAARLANYLSFRLKDFTYYGLDVENSQSRNTIQKFSVQLKDSRVKLGFIEHPIEKEALNIVDSVVLGSVFTHLKFDYFKTICDKLLPILNAGGVVSASVFLSDKYNVPATGGRYAIKDCYQKVFYTTEQIDQYCSENGLKWSIEEEFLAQFVNLHKIIRIISF